MYKVLIVDDEKIVLQGLKNTFKWEEYGFLVNDLAENGREALSILSNNRCDLVVTDIRMPDMDGLELCKKIKSKYPYTHIIIISAYNNFEYAQQAIKHGVSGYLLKPLKDMELAGILTKIRADLDLLKLMELSKVDSNLALKKTMLNSISKHVVLRRLLDENTYIENLGINQYLEDHELWFLTRSVRIALCNIEFDYYATATTGIFKNMAVNTCIYCLERMKIHAIEYAGYIVLFLDGSNGLCKENILRLLLKFGKLIKAEFEDNCKEKYSLTIGVSNYHNKNINLKNIFTEALNSYEYKYYVGDGDIFFYEDLNYQDYYKLDGWNYKKLVKQIINNIMIGEEGQLSESVENLFSSIDTQGNFTIKDINTKLIETYFNISNSVKTINIKDVIDKEGNIINEIQTLTSYKQLKEWFRNKVINIYRMARCYSYDSSDWMIQKAMYYIKANTSKRITLDDIANYLHVNPSYFSSIFKKNTGRNFIDYVTESKIKEAKYLLLNSTLKIKEISGRVGYNDYSYFCKVFKSTENATPLEFRMKGFVGK